MPRNLKANTTAACAGVLTLGIEMAGGRLLAPYLGSSLHQWAALIGVALVSYSLGYAVFERLNRRGPLLPLLLGALYVLSLPVWFGAVADRLMQLPFSVASVGAAVLTVGFPSLLWASLLPYLQKKVGPSASSGILVWSVLGNLAGVWGVAFFSIPAIGTRMTLIVMGCSGLLLALLWLREFGKISLLLISVLACAPWILIQSISSAASYKPWSGQSENPFARRELVEMRDSAYQQLAVWDDFSPVSDLKFRIFTIDGNVQFAWNEKSDLARLPGEDYFNFSTAAVEWVAGAPAKSVLIVGLGGGLTPWQIRRFFPETEITVYELDPAVIEVGGRVLPLARLRDARIHIGDGRLLLKQVQKTFDYIYLDTYLNSYVPFHLTTVEFFRIARERLNPGGILVANFLTAFRDTGLLAKLEATAQSVFSSAGTLELSGTINTLLVASPEKADLTARMSFAAERGAEALRPISASARKIFRRTAALAPASGSPRGDLLTDDKNDTEQRLFETHRRLPLARPY